MPDHDYHDLPEMVELAVARLIDADDRANPSCPPCPVCGHAPTLRVQDAEMALVAAMRQTYVRPGATEL